MHKKLGSPAYCWSREVEGDLPVHKKLGSSAYCTVGLERSKVTYLCIKSWVGQHTVGLERSKVTYLCIKAGFASVLLV